MKPRRASSLHDRISALRALREVEFFNWSEKIEHRVFFKENKNRLESVSKNWFTRKFTREASSGIGIVKLHGCLKDTLKEFYLYTISIYF